MNDIDDGNIVARSKKQLLINTVPFLVFFLLFVGLLITKNGFAIIPEQDVYPLFWKVKMEPFKYLHNFLQMPLVLIIFLAGVVFVLWGIIGTLIGKCKYGIWAAGLGTVLTALSVFLVAGFDNTAYYPSTYDLNSSLTITNSSSSKYTLTAMSYVSLLILFVLAYIFYAWKSINNKKIDAREKEEETHAY